MELALRSAGGEVVVTLDCDDTYPTEDIPRLARLVTEEGYDLVDGSRLGHKPPAMPWLNYLANAGFARWRRSVLSVADGPAQRHEGVSKIADRPVAVRPKGRGAAGGTAVAAGADEERGSSSRLSTIACGSARRRCGPCKAPGGRWSASSDRGLRRFVGCSLSVVRCPL